MKNYNSLAKEGTEKIVNNNLKRKEMENENY